MSLSILLYVVIPFALSTAALGQNVSAECTSGLIAFSQDTKCTGSPEAAETFLVVSFTSFTNLGDAYRLLGNATVQERLTTFYNAHCPSQNCANSYVEGLRICLNDQRQQVNLVNI